VTCGSSSRIAYVVVFFDMIGDHSERRPMQVVVPSSTTYPPLAVIELPAMICSFSDECPAEVSRG